MPEGYVPIKALYNIELIVSVGSGLLKFQASREGVRWNGSLIDRNRWFTVHLMAV